MKKSISKLLKTVGAVMHASPLEVDLPPEWLQPIEAATAGADPCGPSLEYDPEYAVLAARLQPKSDVQYGHFTASASEPDWKEIERDCRRLLLRSKDLNLLVWFTRSRARQAGAAGLLQGLSALQQVCDRFGETVHPQLILDGEFDPAVRANALAALCDPDGLMQDVRGVVIDHGTATRLTVREVERSMSVPRPPYAAAPEVVHRQLADLQQRQDAQLMALQACAACVKFVHDWASAGLADEAPSLAPLMKLLSPFVGSASAALPVHAQRVHAEPVDAVPVPGVRGGLVNPKAVAHSFDPSAALAQRPAALSADSTTLQSREQVRDALAQVREWIEHHEPSSPVAVLLKQAERMWGKRFSEVAHMIPPDLLRAWDQSD